MKRANPDVKDHTGFYLPKAILFFFKRLKVKILMN